MDLRPLRFFIEIVEQGNFTRAAERLHIAQPAISVAIRKLEDELGVALLNRSEKVICPTPEGEVFLQHAREVLAQVTAAERAVADLRGLRRGEVCIGIPAMLGSYYFPDLLIGFKQRYPQLRLSVREHGTRTVQRMIAAGELELGITVTHGIPESIEVHPFRKEEMVACVPSHHPLASRQSLRYEEFAREPLVLFKEGYFQREMIAQAIAQGGPQPEITFETSLIPLIKAAVRRDVGITALLRIVIARDPDLVAIPFDPPVLFEIGIAWKKRSYLSRAHRVFIDYLLECTGAGPAP